MFPAHASTKKCNYNNLHFLPKTENPSELNVGLGVEVTLTNTNGGIQNIRYKKMFHNSKTI